MEYKKKGLFIIESLRDGDKKTGKELYEGTLKYKSFQLNDFMIYYHEGIPSLNYIFEDFQLLGKSSSILLIGWSLMRFSMSLSHSSGFTSHFLQEANKEYIIAAL